jgi:hypothetical protein
MVISNVLALAPPFPSPKSLTWQPLLGWKRNSSSVIGPCTCQSNFMDLCLLQAQTARAESKVVMFKPWREI